VRLLQLLPHVTRAELLVGLGLRALWVAPDWWLKVLRVKALRDSTARARQDSLPPQDGS
jgi:hypothetical protein